MSTQTAWHLLICKIQDAGKISTISKLQSSRCHCTESGRCAHCLFKFVVTAKFNILKSEWHTDSDTFCACWINWVSHSLHNNKCKPPSTNMDYGMLLAKYRDGRKSLGRTVTVIRHVVTTLDRAYRCLAFESELSRSPPLTVLHHWINNPTEEGGTGG